ncbi:MAG: hypothetical protein KC501_35780 [Myxococcales bacterium]|nr:hypothetical protein [Myxococcales bacterium]
MDTASRRALYNECDPAEPLEPDDPRNVDLDALTAKSPRGVVWAEKVAMRFELSAKPQYLLFTGLPGSGKSTELRRLLKRLSDPSGTNLLPILIDADRAIDLANPIGEMEIVAVVVHEVERAVLECEGKDPAEALEDGYLARLWRWLNSEVGLKSLGTSVTGANLAIELKNRPGFRDEVRRAVEPRLTRFLEDARSYVARLERRARTSTGKAGLVVAVDSLEKLRGMSTNWESVIDSAERVFGQQADHVQLPIHTVYTVPAALVARQKHVEFMPAIKVVDRDGRPNAAGINALRTLVNQRIPPDAREELFGSGDQQIRLLEHMIRRSGGYLRELVRSLREAIAEPRLPVDQGFVDRLFSRAIDDYRELVTVADFEWLARISVTKHMTVPDQQRRVDKERFLSQSVVLRYQNDRAWDDLHPAVAEIPGVKAAIERLRSSAEDLA